VTRRRGDKELAEAGESLVAAAFSGLDSEQRLDAVLDLLADLTDAPVHLYTCQNEGGSFALVRSGAPPRLGETRRGGSTRRSRRSRRARVENDDWVDGPGWDEGSDMAQTTLAATLPAATSGRPTAITPAGEVTVLPLRVGTNAARGLVLVGPPTVHDVHRLDSALRVPLTAAISAILDDEQFSRRLAVAESMKEAGAQLQQSAVDTTRFCDLSLRLALRATGAEVAILDVFGPPSRRLAIDLDPSIDERLDLSPSAHVLDWETAVDGGPVLVHDLELLDALGVRSLLALPMMHDGAPLGVVALLNFRASMRFGPEAVSLLATLAEQTNLMLSSEEMMAAFHERYLATLRGLADTLDLRRPWLRGHHSRVAGVATAIAAAMDLGRAEVDTITLAGHLHDIGLAGVIELGDGRQADFEHPALGASLVERLPLHGDVAAAVLTHHEWFDGWGFPAGLSGDELPRGGRILAVAEFAVESTTSDPVHAAWSLDRLESELRTRRGSQFAPEVVDATLDHLDRADFIRSLALVG
jgi:GAF domain-containing protein